MRYGGCGLETEVSKEIFSLAHTPQLQFYLGPYLLPWIWFHLTSLLSYIIRDLASAVVLPYSILPSVSSSSDSPFISHLSTLHLSIHRPPSVNPPYIPPPLSEQPHKQLQPFGSACETPFSFLSPYSQRSHT